MKKKMFCMIGLMIAVFLFVGCEEMQEGVPKDISYVPIDQIKVEDDTSTPPVPDMGDEEVPLSEIPLSDIDEVEEEPEDEILIEELEEIEPEEELEELEELEEEPEEEILIEELEEIEPEEETEEIEMEEIEEEPELIMEPEPVKEILIIVQETDLVNLKPVAYDPDEDTLEFTYSSPLNEEGVWQTTYGDMGEYTVTITASDNELTTSKDALLIVNKKEEAPTLDITLPEETEQITNENTEIEFKIEASDLNNDLLTYVWKFDGEEVSTGESFTYEADYNSAGSHTVKIDVSDGTSIVSLLWSLTIENVDRPPVLKIIPDFTVKETEIVVITPEASDPDGDEITYTISDPVGDSGVWQTTYDDSNVYTVEVTASDGELEDTQEVKITVINVNRPPVIENIIQVE